MTKRLLTIIISLATLLACVMPNFACGEHVHDWGEYAPSVTATCTTKGKEKRTCKTCSEYEERETGYGDHSYGEWNDLVPATCTEDGVKGYKQCSVCHKNFDQSGVEILDLKIDKGHDFGSWVKEVSATYENDGVKGHYECSICHKYFDQDYNQILDEDLVINKLVDDFDKTTGAFPTVQTINGKSYVQLGYYPQTAVTDSQTAQKIDDAVKAGLHVNANGFYQVDGKYYIKKTATPNTFGGSYLKFTDGTEIVKGKDYYFEVQPILWRVLKTDNGSYTLISEKTLDVKVFEDLHSPETENGVTHNPNDYSKSDIRKWLNGEFLQSALLTYEKEFVTLSQVSLGEETLFIPTDDQAYYEYVKYVYDDVEDKIFLPSYADMYNADYFVSDADRLSLATDYARACGTYMVGDDQIGYAKYWLRSAGGSQTNNVSVIDCYGSYAENQTGNLNPTVRPMIVISNPNA